MRDLIMGTMVAAIVVLCGSFAFSADDLFSELPIESVFDSQQDGASLSVSAAKPTRRRVTGASSLSQLLREADFEAKERSSQVVSTKVEGGDWRIPTLLRVLVDSDQLEIVMLLKTLGDEADESSIPSAPLLELMAANGKHAPIFFSYSPTNKRIELRLTTSNLGITSAGLSDQLKRMAGIAVDYQTAWDITPVSSTRSSNPETVESTAAPTTPARPAPSKNEPQVSLATLQGRWIAERAKDQAFALQLNEDNTFVLAVVAGGHSSRSEGRFTWQTETGKLQLSGSDGTKLSGGLKLLDKDRFRLTIDGEAEGKPLGFSRAH